MATATHVSLADLVDDLAEITRRIVWSTVTTTDRLGRPRSRVMHPDHSSRRHGRRAADPAVDFSQDYVHSR